MPRGLVRYHSSGQFHFVTFSCHKRQPSLARSAGYAVFEHALERVRQTHSLVIAGYVLMPEHVHLLVSEPQAGSLAAAIQALKQETSKKLKTAGESQFWQRRYYDFNVWSEGTTEEKLHYMHQNPVKRRLVKQPDDWPWSSFRHHSTGERGAVEIESRWTAQRRGGQLIARRRELTE
jgi:putative transposase